MFARRKSAAIARYMPTGEHQELLAPTLGIPGLIDSRPGRHRTELLKQRGEGRPLVHSDRMGLPRIYERAAAIRYQDANAGRRTRLVLDRLLLSAWPIGGVRTTARRIKHKRGRLTHYFWTADSAVRE